MVGVNQVIMMSLNMVIIASMIGAGGLGFDVLSSLKRLRIGEGIEADHAARYFNFRKASIYGGSNEIQKNIVSKHVLGL